MLQSILSDRKKRKTAVNGFQEIIWDCEYESIPGDIDDILKDLAHDMAFYIPGFSSNNPHESYFGDDKLDVELQNALLKLSQLMKN